MDLIYANSSGEEQGVLLNYYLDIDCGNKTTLKSP